MSAFKDNESKDWILAVDAPTIRAVRKECDGLDLASLDDKPYQLLSNDVVLLVDVLWVICREQAIARDVTDIQFGQRLVGDAIDRATAALLEAITDFFPQSQRSLLSSLVQKNKTVREKAMALTMARIDDPRLMPAMEAAMTERLDKELNDALTRLNSAKSTPELLESALAE